MVPIGDDQGKQDLTQSVCDQQGGSPTEDAQKEAFGKQLPNEAESAGADRKPDGEFMRAGGCSRQQEMSDVHARQQKHGGDHGGQDPDRALIRSPLAGISLSGGCDMQAFGGKHLLPVLRPLRPPRIQIVIAEQDGHERFRGAICAKCQA